MKNKRIAKRTMMTVLALALLWCLPVNVFAAIAPSPEVSPCWDSISNIDLDIGFNDGVGTVVGAAMKQSTADAIEGSLYLYKVVGEDVVYVDEWHGRKEIGSLGLDGTFACESGVTYSAYFVVTAYTDGVPESFTATLQRTCP